MIEPLLPSVIRSSPISVITEEIPERQKRLSLIITHFRKHHRFKVLQSQPVPSSYNYKDRWHFIYLFLEESQYYSTGWKGLPEVTTDKLTTIRPLTTTV